MMGIKFRCVIFDLDGTLADTVADIAEAMNRALVLRGFPSLDRGAYKEKIGWGIQRLAYLALPPAARDEGLAAAVAADAARFYAEHPLVYSKPYPGIPGLIAELRRNNIKTAVLTNKPDPVTQLVAGGLFPPGSFDRIRGDRAGFPRKPDPASVWELLLNLDLTPRETILMGDSEIDMETARAANCHALGVSWGFRDREVLRDAGAERIIDRPEEALDLFPIPRPAEPHGRK
jgi:phosphoglycolate phosphatase